MIFGKETINGFVNMKSGFVLAVVRLFKTEHWRIDGGGGGARRVPPLRVPILSF